jgi:hypothetical protein
LEGGEGGIVGIQRVEIAGCFCARERQVPEVGPVEVPGRLLAQKKLGHWIVDVNQLGGLSRRPFKGNED